MMGLMETCINHIGDLVVIILFREGWEIDLPNAIFRKIVREIPDDTEERREIKKWLSGAGSMGLLCFESQERRLAKELTKGMAESLAYGAEKLAAREELRVPAAGDDWIVAALRSLAAETEAYVNGREWPATPQS